VLPHAGHLHGEGQGVVEVAGRPELAGARLEEEVAVGGGAPRALREHRDVPLPVMDDLQARRHLHRLHLKLVNG